MAEAKRIVGLYIMRAYQKAPSTSDITLVGPKVPQDHYATIESMSIINYTTANKMLLLGMRDASGKDHYSHNIKAANTYCVQANGQVILRENESIIGVCLSPTSADEIYVTAHGFIYPMY